VSEYQNQIFLLITAKRLIGVVSFIENQTLLKLSFSRHSIVIQVFFGSGLNALKCKRGRLQHTKYYAFSVHAKL